MPTMSFYYILLFGLILLLPQSSESCSDHIMSISNLNKCSGTFCSFEEVVHKRLELATDTDLCIRLNRDLANEPSVKYNLKVLHSQIFYNLVDCYLSDDPETITNTFCGCPGGTPTNCTNCPEIPNGSPYSFCIVQTYASSDCFVRRQQGRYCVRFHMSGNNRYRVCSLSTPSIDLLLQSDTPSGTRQQEVVLSGTSFSWDAQDWNITLYPNTISNSLQDKVMIQDLQNPQTFYLVPSNLVNSIYTRNPQLAGWFRKSDSSPVTPPAESITTRPTSCQNNEIFSSLSMPTFYSLLQDEFLFMNVKPGSLLIHEDAPKVQIGVVSDYSDLETIGDGGWFLNANGVPFPLGVFEDDRWPHLDMFPDTVSGMAMTGGAAYTGAVVCSDWIIVGTNANGVIISLRECGIITNGIVSRWGWQRQNVDTSVNPPVTTIGSAGAASQVALIPVGSRNPYVARIVAQNFDLTRENSVSDVADGLAIDPDQESIELTVELQELNITIDFSNVKPEILKLEDRDGYIGVQYHSRNDASGKCLLGSNNDVTATAEVQVHDDPEWYDLPVIVHKFEGSIDIVLKCSSFMDSVKFKLDIDRGEVNIKEHTINDTSVKSRTIDEHKSWLSGGSDWWLSLGMPTWLNQTFSVIIYMIVIFVVLLLCWYVFIPLLMFCCRKTKSSMQPKYKVT